MFMVSHSVSPTFVILNSLFRTGYYASRTMVTLATICRSPRSPEPRIVDVLTLDLRLQINHVEYLIRHVNFWSLFVPIMSVNGPHLGKEKALILGIPNR
jgi:hypothetical protein